MVDVCGYFCYLRRVLWGSCGFFSAIWCGSCAPWCSLLSANATGLSRMKRNAPLCLRTAMSTHISRFWHKQPGGCDKYDASDEETHTNGLAARTRISSHSSSAAQVITFRYSHLCYKIVARGSRFREPEVSPQVRDWTQINTSRVKFSDYIMIYGA